MAHFPMARSTVAAPVDEWGGWGKEKERKENSFSQTGEIKHAYELYHN